MNTPNLELHGPNIICVGIDKKDGYDYEGKIWHQYSDNYLTYKGTMELVQKMDGLYDIWDFPQRSTDCRSFIKKEKAAQTADKRRAGQKMEEHRIRGKQGDLGTFIVQVKYRQNSTWQGEVIWAEGKEKRNFRSALELLKMIDGVIDEVSKPDETDEAEDICPVQT